MKKTLKNRTARVITLMLIAVLILSSLPVYAGDSSNTAKQYLISIGYPSDFCNRISEDKLMEIYTELKDENVEVLWVVSDLASLEDGVPEDGQRGSIPTSDMELALVGTAVLGSGNKINYVRVDVDWNWFDWKPNIRGTDALAVNWDKDIFTFEPGYFSAYDKHMAGTTVIDNYYDAPNIAEQGGIGWYADLYFSTAYKVFGEASFKLLPTAPMYRGDTYTTGINIQYVHNTRPATTISFTIKDNLGIGINLPAGADDTTDGDICHFNR